MKTHNQRPQAGSSLSRSGKILLQLYLPDLLLALDQVRREQAARLSPYEALRPPAAQSSADIKTTISEPASEKLPFPSINPNQTNNPNKFNL